MKMQEVIIPLDSVFIGPGYLQHACREWHGTYYLQYYMYLIVEGVELKDTIDFAYGEGLSTAVKAEEEVEGEDSAVVERDDRY